MSDEVAIEVVLNGEQRSCPGGLDLEATLRHFGYEPRLVVVEFNGAILPRSLWPDQRVREADGLEVVTIVGGGF
ncbi:sulfur carrier protein ThiS [Cyanobium sp. Morenito 9A2]|uniref:sulfur carrier protein ThiS n=1 Tax=Cyanobium sp. Morenito 9A2 TaxID=2823718 RepID=UPI0020CC320E|nr:sulfur carrier protein ThiS [Cyanobium sp. Morenito 9A2]MCP9849715.1 sulfur carrier protein ThiS [Cyanobium sp. Morenito 9A2]